MLPPYRRSPLSRQTDAENKMIDAGNRVIIIEKS
jgi:hypothetical protein